MAFIPMTRATGLGSLPQLLEQRAGFNSLKKVFDTSSVPLSVIEERQIAIPLRSMCNLFDLGARVIGDRMFGLSAGLDMTYRDFGLWLRYAAQGRTLGEALERAQRCSWVQQSGGRLHLLRRNGLVAWCYQRPADITAGPHHSDHLIGPMTRFIRVYSGPDWTPLQLDLDYPRDPEASVIEVALPYPIRFGQSCIALWFPASELACVASNSSMRGVQTITYNEVQASAYAGHQPEPVKSIQQIITMRLLEGRLDIDGVAKQCGLGVQRLQRTLRSHGLSYRELLTRAVMRRAQGLLLESDHPIVDIALSLGYSDHANFTRAFRNHYHMSPSKYRSSVGQYFHL